MKFKIVFASNLSLDSLEEDINTLNNLQELQETYGYPMVIDFNNYSIIIYDDYLE